MRSKFLKTVAAAAFAIAATGASAETITLQAQSGGVFGSVGAETVQTNVTGSQSISAGAFRVEDATDAARKFLAWCVDLSSTLSLPGPYTQTMTALDATVRNNLQKLFNTAYLTLDVDNRVQAAGFQLAIWEIVEETGSSFNLTKGSFRVTQASSSVLAAGQAFLNGLSGPQTEIYNLSFWESGVDKRGNPLSQDLVTAAPIPLPAAAWMLIAALAATAAATRRRRAA